MDEFPVETTLYSLSDTPPPPGERRDGERHLTLLRVGALIIGERRELCLIRNVSAGGMLIRAYCQVETGTRLAVELKQGEPVEGTARWVNGDCVGVTFDQPVDVVDLLSTSMEGPRPRMPRVEVGCIAWVREGARVNRTFARDVSQGGIKVQSQRELTIGADVVVTLNGLSPHPGLVRWREGDTYGITFVRVLPLPELVAWLQDQRDRLRKAG